MARLENKTCIITGAARGIGEAIVRAYLDEGARVVVTDKDVKSGEALAFSIDAEFFELDIAKEDHWDGLAKAYPNIDVLVNNAGITGFEGGVVPHDPEHAALADWRAVHRVNTDGTFLGCRYAIKAMREAGSGSIINMSSRSGMVGIPAASAYAASKAAIRNHTKTVALYCAQQGLNIRCNSVHPAAIMTPMWEPMLPPGEQDRKQAMQALVKDIPLRRFGEPSEVAAICVLLASDEASYITGAEFTIDGGILAGSAAAPGG